MPTTNQVLGALRAAGDEREAALLLGIAPGQVHEVAEDAPPLDEAWDDVGLLEWARRRAARELHRSPRVHGGGSAATDGRRP
jgi:hypothetical protein